MGNKELRKLPSVDRLLQTEAVAQLVELYGNQQTLEALRATLDSTRQSILAGDIESPSSDELIAQAAQRLQADHSPSLYPVINATGVIVHTNLGRSPLSDRAQKAITEISTAYSNLEFDMEDGKRGSRYDHARQLLTRLTGAEDALVVNNNAAAVLLTLTALASNREVLISRSQLIEIGGGFRIPDVMRQSGAQLVEVGTTNRTYVRDYSEALHPINTALLLQVHHSNFSITGFVHQPTLSDLVELGDQYAVPVMEDLGSGTLLDTEQYGLVHEPTIQESIAAGASIVTASGDKLLGGPQAGLIVGKSDIIAKLRQHPLTRALRVDKTTLAALQATLLAYLDGKACQEIPVWRMIASQPADLRQRARKWQKALKDSGIPVNIVSAQSPIGGGSLPGQTLPTFALALDLPSPQEAATRLRHPKEGTGPAVVTRIDDNHLILDPRTVLPEQDPALIKAIRSILCQST